MSELREINHITYDYAWSQFVKMRHMNKLLDELYDELNRRNSLIFKEREQAEYDYDYEMDDDD